MYLLKFTNLERGSTAIADGLLLGPVLKISVLLRLSRCIASILAQELSTQYKFPPIQSTAMSPEAIKHHPPCSSTCVVGCRLNAAVRSTYWHRGGWYLPEPLLLIRQYLQSKFWLEHCSPNQCETSTPLNSCKNYTNSCLNFETVQHYKWGNAFRSELFLTGSWCQQPEYSLRSSYVVRLTQSPGSGQ